MSATDDNLAAAFAGESQARNKYTYYAEIARKEGYHYIAKIFDETAENERRHAKDEFKLLGGLGDTLANLKAAFEGEDYEVTTMYPEFAEQAKADGNVEAARLFAQIAKVEAHHRDRYAKLVEMVEKDTVFTRDEPIRWKCGVCGYVFDGKQPPPKCPCCKHPREHFEPANLDI
jgi:rubrerythrin